MGAIFDALAGEGLAATSAVPRDVPGRAILGPPAGEEPADPPGPFGSLTSLKERVTAWGGRTVGVRQYAAEGTRHGEHPGTMLTEQTANGVPVVTTWIVP